MVFLDLELFLEGGFSRRKHDETVMQKMKMVVKIARKVVKVIRVVRGEGGDGILKYVILLRGHFITFT